MSTPQRKVLTATLTIADSANVSDGILMENYAGGLLICPASVAGYIHFQTSADGTNFYNLYDRYGLLIYIYTAAIASITANELPDSLFACRYLKLATHTTQTGTTVQNQTGAKAFTLVLKS